MFVILIGQFLFTFFFGSVLFFYSYFIVLSTHTHTRSVL